LFIFNQRIAAVTVKLVTISEDLLKNLLLGDIFDEHISSLSPTNFVSDFRLQNQYLFSGFSY